MAIKSKKSVYIKPDYLKTQTQINTPTSQVSEPDQITVFAIDPDAEIVPDIYQQPAGQSKPDMMENNGTINSINPNYSSAVGDFLNIFDEMPTNDFPPYTDTKSPKTLHDYYLKEGKLPDFIDVQPNDPVPDSISTYEGTEGHKHNKRGKITKNDAVRHSKNEIRNANDLSIMNESMTNTIDNFLSEGSTKNYLMVAFIITIVGIMIYKS